MKKINQRGFAHIILIVAGTVLLGGAASGVASNSARPGDLLYPVDQAWEGFRHALTFGEEAEAKLHMNQAQERLGELNSLINGNADQDKLDQAARNYGDHVEEALGNAEKIGNSDKKGEVLAAIAEDTLVDQDTLLAEDAGQGEQVKAAVETAMQHANKGYEQSYGQLSGEAQAQVMEKVRARVSNMDQLMEQVQLQEQTQENKPEETGSDNKPEDAGSGSDNANQGEESSQPTDSGSESPSNGADSSSGQGNN